LLPQQSKPLATVLAIAIGSLIGCRAITGPNAGAPMMTTPPRATPSISDIEKYARLKMPSSAHDIHAYLLTEAIDALVVITFRLPSSDLPRFLAGAGYLEPLEPPGDEFYQITHFLGFNDKLSEWPTDAAWEDMLQDPSRVLRAADVDEPGFHRSILVDQTDPNLYSVYLVHFES